MRNTFVLLVDDDEDDAEIFVEAIRTLNNNIEVQTYDSAVKALSDLKRSVKKPDFLFLDMEMPMMTGNEFITQIIENKLLQSVTIYIYTSHCTNLIEKMTYEDYNINYLTKPNDFKNLVDLLGAILLTND